MEQTTGSKRKRDTSKFYSVHAGHRPGVYYTWSDCFKQVKGFKGAIFKAFNNQSDAEKFLKDPSAQGVGTKKYYAVRNGREPGIYTNWALAQEQIKGWSKPKYKCFATQAEAQQFMDESQRSIDYDASKEDLSIEITDVEAKRQRILDSNDSRKHIRTPAQTAHLSRETGVAYLSSNIEDGFDPEFMLDQTRGYISPKSGLQLQATKFMPSTLHKEANVCVYTDGSSLGNGRKDAVAGVGVYFGAGDPRNISEPLPSGRQTNQRAELQAILRALETVPRHRSMTIVSDSQYGIKCVTQWSANWQRNGWRTSSGKAVDNRDLVESILEKMDQRVKAGARTHYEWVKGHGSDNGNQEADKLARQGAGQSL